MNAEQFKEFIEMMSRKSSPKENNHIRIKSFFGTEDKDPIECSELNVNPNYDTIALNVVNSYLEEEPKNSYNDNNDETWYPCNEEIPEDWLNPNDCKKLITTSVEVELEAIEKLDKANNSI
ncbi:14524_t:CDS:2 [Gigaspora margarita]|uniref:14524_t:CDS:1 n=1 Tax=Gigaspora margarita TaxID=4874 RepID=A0ABM8W695_GIGMA|nr:14524_t:CDS:2 [Gigaspora margarita]